MITFKPLFGYLAYNRITDKELAQRIGVTPLTVTKLKKNGSYSPRLLDKICTCLNLGIKDIMRYEEKL